MIKLKKKGEFAGDIPDQSQIPHSVRLKARSSFANHDAIKGKKGICGRLRHGR
jgi:hypothetical protein